eukprot:16168-Eustigmatos_ZCMA.PRE.1
MALSAAMASARSKQLSARSYCRPTIMHRTQRLRCLSEARGDVTRVRQATADRTAIPAPAASYITHASRLGSLGA